MLKPIEVAIRGEFIPTLFGGLDGDIDDDLRRLLANGVKQGGVALRNPCDMSDMLSTPPLKQQVFWSLLSMVVRNSATMYTRSRCRRRQR